jgi:hypothetical protein
VLRNPDDPQRMVRKAMDIRQLLELPPPPALQMTLPQVIVGGLGRVPAYPHPRQEAAGPPPLDAPADALSPPMVGRTGAAMGPGPGPTLPVPFTSAVVPDGAIKGDRAGRVIAVDNAEPGGPGRAR